ncbi:DUF6638 family protein [Aurantibacter sp.]|uniref:DUF6638 family protein n=1 Tax=Aurantibacter sp. TaxID=2807103 RepID=UPI0035C86236
MQKLKEANLYNHELIPISGKLVERYNTCLIKLGFTPTKLTNFHIDGIGWSPEIANEKDNVSYLNNGEANLHGILISPLQYKKPVYEPFHTFDREMMQQVFSIHGDKIKDITRDCAICIDFDQYIDAFYEPLDVLKYKDVEISFHLINDLEEKQKEQRRLISKFKTDHNFIDEDLQAELLESANSYGDLRDRDLSLHSLTYTSSSFYTKAFGGVYVLRDFIKPIVVFNDLSWYKEAIKDTIYDVLLFNISQPELIEKLKDHTIVSCDLERIVQTERYERIKKFELISALKETTHSKKDILNDPLLFKSYLNKLDIKRRKHVMSVELYLEKLEVSNQYKIADLIDNDLYFGLHEPHSSLTTNQSDLIWKLLNDVSVKDVLHLYWYDKEAFYKAYNAWDDGFKDWVIETISNKIG